MPGRPGALLVTICPGKHDERWARDLAVDLRALVAQGVRHVVYLLPDEEFAALGIHGYAEALRAGGLVPHALPIPDGGTLGPGGFERTLDLVNDVRMRISLGERVLVHCRGGLGRAGTFAACVLVSDGMEANEAIRLVREHRPGAIENPLQEGFVADFRAWLARQALLPT